MASCAEAHEVFNKLLLLSKRVVLQNFSCGCPVDVHKKMWGNKGRLLQCPIGLGLQFTISEVVKRVHEEA
jgi:hypothetical protein